MDKYWVCQLTYHKVFENKKNAKNHFIVSCTGVLYIYDSFSVKIVHRVTKYEKIESLKNNFFSLVLGLYVNEKGKSKIFLQNSPFLAD